MARVVDAKSLPVRVAILAVTLALLFLVTFLALNATSSPFEGSGLTMLVGFVLLASSVAGRLAVSTGLPRLTGFLLVGIVAGPSMVGILPASAVRDLRLIDDFALALIAMLAGGELKVSALRPRARTIVLTMLLVTGMVWVGVAAAVLAVRPLVPPLAALPISSALGVALLVGIWAANSSPDLTVAVVEETDSKGPLTDVILGTTILKDVLVIVLFTLTVALVSPLLEPGEVFSADVLWRLAREVGGALVVGGVLGWVFSLYLGSAGDEPRPPAATFIFAYVLVVLADQLHLELLLAAVAAGFVIENLSPAGDRMIRGIVSVSVVFFAFFFTIAGAGLDLQAVKTFWLAGALLFGARVFFTWLGARYGTRWARAPAQIQERTWQGLLSQGGVTLGLLLVIQTDFPAVGSWLVSVGMAIVLGNILLGPVLLKRALTAGARHEDASVGEASA